MPTVTQNQEEIRKIFNKSRKLVSKSHNTSPQYKNFDDKVDIFIDAFNDEIEINNQLQHQSDHSFYSENGRAKSGISRLSKNNNEVTSPLQPKGLREIMRRNSNIGPIIKNIK